jgi:hypothetical protein
VGKFTVVVSILPQSSADDGADRYGQASLLVGIGAAQKGAGSKPTVDRHWVASLVVGILIALLIGVGLFLLLVSQQ